MAGTVYKHTQPYYGEYASFIQEMSGDNSKSHALLLKNLTRAVREELTERQWEMMSLYYMEQMKMQDIADLLCVNVSTVSRTIARGRDKLKRCLRYGAKELLREAVAELEGGD